MTLRDALQEELFLRTSPGPLEAGHKLLLMKIISEDAGADTGIPKGDQWRLRDILRMLPVSKETTYIREVLNEGISLQALLKDVLDKPLDEVVRGIADYRPAVEDVLLRGEALPNSYTEFGGGTTSSYEDRGNVTWQQCKSHLFHFFDPLLNEVLKTAYTFMLDVLHKYGGWLECIAVNSYLSSELNKAESKTEPIPGWGWNCKYEVVFCIFLLPPFSLYLLHPHHCYLNLIHRVLLETLMKRLSMLG